MSNPNAGPESEIGVMSALAIENVRQGPEGEDSTQESIEMPNDHSVPVVDITPHGDVILCLNLKAKFRVSSVVLCLASPVFRTMLGPSSNFKEACDLKEATTDPYTLLLDDDCPTAFSIILYAIHLQSDKVIWPLEYHTMQDLAVICDKYGCAKAVESWVPFWRDLTVDIQKRWLFVVWVFGREGPFTLLTKQIILEGYYQKPSGWLEVDGVCLNQQIPSSVVKGILHRRKLTINRILECARSLLQQYGASVNPKCRYKIPSHQCDMMILGSITHAFQSLGLLPNHNKLLLMSINKLKTTLNSMKVYFLPISKQPCTLNPHSSFTQCPNSAPDSHENTCNPLPKFFADIERLVSRVEGLKLGSLR